MRPLVSAIVTTAVITAALVPALALADAPPKTLQGSWIAARVTQDGKPAPDLVGHKLTFSGEKFQIVSKAGKKLFSGTAQVEAAAKPPAIDFKNTDGEDKGKTWKGIYRLSGETLTIADNAPDLDKPRPKTLDAKAGSGYVVFVFTRAPK